MSVSINELYLIIGLSVGLASIAYSFIDAKEFF